MKRLSEKLGTDSWLYKGAFCPYKILLPKDASALVLRAAEELQTLFSAATGICLQAVTDDNPIASPVLSLGKTVKAKMAGVSFADNSGFIVTVKGSDVFMLGGNDEGTLFAVYGFMEELFGYKYYAPDEIALEHCSQKEFLKFELIGKPDIAVRALGEKAVAELNEENYRCRLGSTLYSDFTISCHTFFRILPKEKYFAEHPDWYNKKGDNLCLSNTEMREEFIAQVKRFIDEDPYKKYFMIGQEDTQDFCDCEKCKAETVESGLPPSVLLMRFVNAVAEEASDYLDEKYPGSPMKFITFAYNATAVPPARLNSLLLKYEPVDETVKAHPRVGVMIVPYNCNYSYALGKGGDTDNENIINHFRGWKAVCDTLLVWDYSVNFTDYLTDINNWEAIGANYGVYKQFGVEFVYTQGIHDAERCSFSKLRLYCQSRLLWDTDLQIGDLIEEFCCAYYKSAAPYILCYLRMLSARCRLNEKIYNVHAHSWGNWSKKEFWPLTFLDECKNLFDEAKNICSDEPVIRKCVEREELMLRYLRIKLYPETLKNGGEEKKMLLNDFDEFGITFCAEGIPVQSALK